MKKKLKTSKGITLVALVVTIVVLLILAGVSISLVLGENGLITQAQEAKRKTQEASTNELAEMERMKTELAKYGNTKSVFEGGEWNETLGLCTPKLGSNMVGVYWSDGTTNEVGLYNASTTSTTMEVTSDKEGFSWAEWYSYIKISGTDDSKTSRWANAKSTTDGSYFVWIPRYEYKILSGEHTSTAGEIDVQFINLTTTTADKEGYKVHPAFTKNLQLGGWDSEIPGIWVAKYEMSMEETTDSGRTWKNSESTSGTGNKAISATVRAVSKPSQYSWNYINITNCFNNSLNYSTLQTTGANSHLMKNSEWGAVAYLTQSKYGRNNHEISINSYNKDSTNYAKLTGVGGSSADNKYNTTNGMNASTTGNLYGIYDLSGGNWEYTSVLYSKYTNGNGTALYAHTANGKYAKDVDGSQLPDNSSKYVTIYPIDTTIEGDDGSMDMHYSKWSEIYGDAIYETSSQCGSNTSWYGDRADEDSGATEGVFCIRGGQSLNTSTQIGVFAFADDAGGAWGHIRLPSRVSLRVAL